MSTTQLNETEKHELHKWLAEHNINPSKISREFSDAVPVANLLKKIFPKLVDMHNYPTANSLHLKLINWEVLNQKVLHKIGIGQNRNVLERLAKAMPGAMEALLRSIQSLQQNMTDQVKDKIRLSATRAQEQEWSENDDVVTITVNKMMGDAIIQVPQKMILYSIYEQSLNDARVKDDQLAAGQQKIAHLENILRMKSARIDELCAQLAKLTVRSTILQQNIASDVNAAHDIGGDS